MRSAQEVKSNYDVIISGMGGAGLTAAWEAATSNPDAKILIINNKSEEFMRENVISLTINNSIYLYKMLENVNERGIYNPANKVEDDKFDIEMVNNRVSIKSVERFIKRRLDELKQSGVNIDYVNERQLSEVDLETGLAKISPYKKANNSEVSDDSASFKYLVGAEGNKRRAWSLASRHDERIAKLIQFEKEEPLLHPNHFSAYLVAKLEDGSLISRGDFSRISTMSWVKINSNSLDNSRETSYFYLLLPESYSFKKSKKSQFKFSFTGEIPENILKIENAQERKKEILSYVQKTVAERWRQISSKEIIIEPTKPSTKFGLAKDNLKYLEFNTTRSMATLAGIESIDSSPTKTLVLIGDAVRTSNWQKGTGMNSAIRHAQLFGRLFRKEITMLEYNQNIKALSEDQDPFRPARGNLHETQNKKSLGLFEQADASEPVSQASVTNSVKTKY